MKTSIIIGGTYTKKREIKAIGGRWDYDSSGWVIPDSAAEKALELCLDNNWRLDEIEVDDDYFEELTGEKLREFRQSKIDRKKEKLYDKARRLKNKSEQVYNSLPQGSNDFAFITQPILVGHHSEKAHRNLRARIANKMDKSMELYNEAEQARERANNLFDARVKGDAAARRQAERDYLDQFVKIGMHVAEYSCGGGIVTKINKKTYTIQFDRGFTSTVDKSYINPQSLNIPTLGETNV